MSQIVKLQNKAVRVINNVPLMESITPHYSSLGFLKFPIVKLNRSMLFYDYFHHDKFPNLPVSLVSQLIITVPVVDHPTKLQYLDFELILGEFAPALMKVSFGIIFRNPLETNHLKNMSGKALLRWYLAQY